MSTPSTPIPQDSFSGDITAAPPAPVVVTDPDNPPWGVGMAILVWVINIGSMIFIPLVALIPYFVIRIKGGADIQQVGQAIGSDPVALLITLVATVPAHVLTLFVIWAIVTRLGKRPFWRTIGWSWGGRFGFWWSVVTSIGLLALGILITNYFGGQKTPFDEMLESSTAARFTTAALATLSAPLVEELVFRGIIYPALQRAFARLIAFLKAMISPLRPSTYGDGGVTVQTVGVLGFLKTLPLRVIQAVLTFFGTLDARQGGMLWSIIIVSALFLSVHIPQYQNNLAVIAAVGMLSVVLTTVRALTGRVLPCFIIHLVFNSVQVAGLIYEYFQPGKPAGDTKAGLIIIVHHLSTLAPQLSKLSTQLSAVSFFHF